MKSFSVAFMVLAVVMALASLAAAQSFGDFFPGFAAPQSAAAGSGGRSNTGNAGPILFPNTPPGSETSGVVVGASGFGFVPPGGRAGGARGVYPSLNGLVAGPNLRPGPGLGPGLGPGPLGTTSLVSSSFRLGPLQGPLRSPLGGPALSPLGVPGHLGRAPTTRLRPSVSYSTTHGAPAGAIPSASLGPLLWRLPAGRSSSFLSGNSASFTSGSFGSDDYL